MAGNRHFTEEQRVAIESDGAILLNAAAGSGKTTVLVQRYLRLIEKGISPYEMLTVTFTKEAADQLRRRILSEATARGFSPKILKGIEQTTYIGTLHSFCFHLINQLGTLLELPRIEKILTPFEFSHEFKHSFDRALGELPETKLNELLHFWTIPELRQLGRNLYADRFSISRLPGIPDEEAPLSTPPLPLELYRLFSSTLNDLARGLLRRGIYSFDELEHFAELILRASSEARDKLREQFKAIFIDEFQDTSVIQWKIVTHIVGDHFDKLFLVGDPKQSIYRFRHAEVQLFLDLQEKITDLGGQNLFLTANFRSQPHLITEINRVSQSLFRSSSLGEILMRAGRESTLEEKALTVLLFAGDSQNEAAAAAKSVREKIATGVPPSAITLLFRNSDRIPLFSKIFSEQEIPVFSTPVKPLFEHYEVRALCDLLRFAVNPLDSHALAGVLRSPYINLTNGQLSELIRPDPKRPLVDVLQEHPALDWLARLPAEAGVETAKVLEYFFTRAEYFAPHPSAVLAFLEALLTQPTDIWQAVERVDIWERESLLFQEPATRRANAVQLMTVHAAKGLEFPHVYLVDNLRLPPRQYPLVRRKRSEAPLFRYRSEGELTHTDEYTRLHETATEQDREESKRILYVALTRAEETLTVLLPASEKKLPKDTWGSYFEQAWEEEKLS